MSDNLKRYLSVKQVCELLPVCKSLVYRMVRSGEIPSARLGGKILVPVDDLRAILEGNRKVPAEVPSDLPPRSGRKADGFAAYYQQIMDEVTRKARR